MHFCLYIFIKNLHKWTHSSIGVCRCPRLKKNIQKPKPSWAGQQQVEARPHFLCTVVKAGIWMGWIEWTGWKTGFFRMSESVFTEGSSWFLLMICSASCVLPTRQPLINKSTCDVGSPVLRAELTSQPRPRTLVAFLFTEMLMWAWKTLDKSKFGKRVLLHSAYSELKRASFCLRAINSQRAPLFSAIDRVRLQLSHQMPSQQDIADSHASVKGVHITCFR